MFNKFNKCCDNRKEASYDIIHSPKPLEISEELRLCLEWLLWYAPDINSTQSTKNELISKTIYDDVIFNIIIKSMGLTSNDIKIVNKDIHDDLQNYYRKSICERCQKLIFRKRKKKTKSEELLRHVRNIIAHGNFNIVGELLIGFDLYKGENNAIIKINPSRLLNAIREIDSGITQEKIWKYSFEKAGYIVKSNLSGMNKYDLEIEKNDITFLVEIKLIKKGWIGLNLIRPYLQEIRHNTTKNEVPVLIIDEGRLTKEVKRYLNKENIIVLDKKSIEDFLSGQDVLIDLYKNFNRNK